MKEGWRIRVSANCCGQLHAHKSETRAPLYPPQSGHSKLKLGLYVEGISVDSDSISFCSGFLKRLESGDIKILRFSKSRYFNVRAVIISFLFPADTLDFYEAIIKAGETVVSCYWFLGTDNQIVRIDTDLQRLYRVFFRAFLFRSNLFFFCLKKWTML